MPRHMGLNGPPGLCSSVGLPQGNREGVIPSRHRYSGSSSVEGPSCVDIEHNTGIACAVGALVGIDNVEEGDLVNGISLREVRAGRRYYVPIGVMDVQVGSGERPVS